MADNELFRTTLMGGYDKDDVEKHIQKMKDEAYVNQNRLRQIVKQKEQTIQELTDKLEDRESQLRQKDRDIREKYQTYIDNYEQIGRLVYESRVRADRMIIDARDESRRIIQEARSLARRRLDQVQDRIDDKLDEGRRKYKVIQQELDELLKLLNEVRECCMESYRNVEGMIENHTEQEDPFADIMSELDDGTGSQEKKPGEEPGFQEQIFYMKQQLSEELPEEEEELDEEDSPEELEMLGSIRREIDDEDSMELELELPRILSVEDVLRSIGEEQSDSEEKTNADADMNEEQEQ